jgi:hypothetical protein
MTHKYIVPAKQHWIMIAVLVLISIVYVSFLVAADISSSQYVEAAKHLGVTIDLNYRFTRMKWRIALALIVAMFALWPRSRKWFLVSAIALAWLVVEYAMWYIDSLRGRAEAGVPNNAIPRTAYLDHATWFDIGIVSIALGVLSWQIWLLVTSQRAGANRP